ncbi:MAG: diaminopimelate epimerase, partial [Clostridia bacterium]|nr:diaminopimelate epimerase [Clostridia bacterium]
MKFTKMHGIGNDYVYVDCFSQKPPADPAALSAVISRPHTGVGSDGLILIEPCEGADARMRIFNKDGSEGEMCGNGIRCVGKYLYDSGIAQKPVIRVMTRGGMKLLEMLTDGEKALGARVDMGEMRFDPKDIPVNAESNEVHIEAEGVRAMF